LVTRETEAAFTIVNLSFSDDGKWRLYDGQNPVWVRIEDEAFLRQVGSNEIAFAKDDVLVCRVRVDQWQTAKGLHSDTTVLQVMRHISAIRQLPLPLDKPPDAPPAPPT
jgi:hypothetical protein